MSTISRREFIHMSGLAVAGMTLAACAKKEEATAAPTATPKEEPKAATATPVPEAEAPGNQAPGLAELVASGALPPVDERMPSQAMVVGPGVLVVEEHLDWEVGTYEGGILRTVTTNPTWSYPCQHALENIINTPKHHTGPMSGNIVESFTVNDDVTEYTFTMRPGMKWSDGEPLTTEDVAFAWEDCLLNEQITPALSEVFKDGAKPAGDPMTLAIVDDFHFNVTFKSPTGRFLNEIGMGNLWDPYCDLMKPKHYLTQFHADYTPVADLKPLLDEEGLTADEWHRLFSAKGGTWWGGGCEHEGEELPVLRGWIIMPSPEEQIIMERNPFYHKVDTEGKQLPYIGRVEAKVVATSENIPSTIITGEINFCREILRHTDVALYKEHEGESYVVNLDMVYHNAPVAFMLNYNNPNPVWQQVVLDIRFRRAINAAINNQEIIDALYLGLGTHSPWFPAVDDAELANQLLDEIGMDQRDADGFRLGPDGQPFEVFFEIPLNPLFAQPAELISQHLEGVGLRCPLKQLEPALFYERRDANELYAGIDWMDDCNWPYIHHWDRMPDTRMRWGRLWHDWMRTEGEEGIEPPDWIKELYEIDTELQAVNPNTQQAEAALQRFAEWEMTNIPVFPVARDVADPCIVPPNLGNVPHAGRSSAMMFSEEQLFFKQA